MKIFKRLIISIVAVLTLSACGSSAKNQHGFSSMIFPTYKKVTIEEFSDLFNTKAFEYDESKNKVIFKGESENLVYKGLGMDLSVQITETYDSEGTPTDFIIQLDMNRKVVENNGTTGTNILYRSNDSDTKFWATKNKSSGKNIKGSSSGKKAEREFHNVIESVMKMLKSKERVAEISPKKVKETSTKGVASGLEALRQGMNYSDARKIILNAGWQGNNKRWQDVSEYGRENFFYHKNGWREVQGCTPTGMAVCNFEFHDIHSNLLVVHTGGECESDDECDQGVGGWTLQ